jgi:hypothetical protein
MFRDRNQAIRGRFSPWNDDQMPPRCLSLAQSAQFHAQGLKLPKFGSLEPGNSGHFRVLTPI